MRNMQTDHISISTERQCTCKRLPEVDPRWFESVLLLCPPMFMQFTGCHQPVQQFLWLKIQLTGCDNANNMRNATCADTMSGPTAHSFLAAMFDDEPESWRPNQK